VLEGVVTRPGDMDVIWVNGFGFPREKGGIMHWSSGIGFAEIAEIIDRDFRPEDPARWPVCDFIALEEILRIAT
jgi:3-hydroxyacyl-CoA dehydrogenase